MVLGHHKGISKLRPNQVWRLSSYKFRFRTILNLIHILQKDCVHEMKKDFNCDLCSFTTSYKKSLIQHIDTIHEKKRDFKCSMCDYSASQNVNLEQHVKSIHEKKKDFKCLKCDYSTSVKSNLTRHFSRHHEPTQGRWRWKWWQSWDEQVPTVWSVLGEWRRPNEAFGVQT